MPRSINPNNVRRVQVEMIDGSFVELSQAELYEQMQQGRNGGLDVDRAADGVQALVGLFEKFEINDLVEDEKDARADLKDANQKLFTYCKNTAQVSGPALADLLKKQMQAQEDLDQAQTEIGRALDRAVLVASGAAGAKALFSTRYASGGGAYGALGGNAGTVLGVLGGVAAYKLLEDDNDRGSRRRNRIGVSTSPE